MGKVQAFLLRNALSVRIGGIAFSIVLAVVVDATGIATRGEAFLVGLVGVLIVMLLEAEVREKAETDSDQERFRRLTKELEALTEQTRKHIAWERFFESSIVTAAGTHETLQSETLELVRDAMIKSHQATTKYQNGLIPTLVSDAWRELNRECDDLVAGKARRDVEQSVEVMLRATNWAKSWILGVTNIPQIATADPKQSWWNVAGRRYRDANREAFRRGVKIFRILVFEDETSMSDRLAFASAVFEGTQASSMTWGILSVSELPMGQRLNLTVWDGVAAWEGKMNATGQMIGSTYHEAPIEVRHLVSLCSSIFDVLPPDTRQNWVECGYTLRAAR
jgi:hypothetical protein